MASKKEKAKRLEEEKQKAYNKQVEKFPIYNIVIIVALAVLFLTYFFNWVYVYNTSFGTEVKVSGWSFFVACITGEFTSANKIYGDLAMPFYYDAKSYCLELAPLTVVAIALTTATLIVVILALITKKNNLSIIAVLTSLSNFVVLIVCFSIALSMKDGTILSRYCSNNPACSIRSLAIIPAILSILITAFSGYMSFKLIKARIKLKK